MRMRRSTCIVLLLALCAPAVPIILCMGIGWGFVFLQNRSSDRYYSNVLRGSCPTASESEGRWNPTKESIDLAIRHGADPSLTKNSFVQLSGDGSAELHDVPALFFLSRWSHIKDNQPYSARGSWNTSDYRGKWKFDVSVAEGSHELWLEHEGTRLRMLLIYSAPDLQRVMRYERTGNIAPAAPATPRL